MLLPGLAFVLFFSYVPMGGLIIAFQKFMPTKGLFGDQRFVGLKNFEFVMRLPGFMVALRNTVIISLWKILTGLAVPIIVALMLNEVRSSALRRTVQTMVYLPYFLSWVLLSGILIDILSPSSGIVNQFIRAIGGSERFFLGDNRYFQGTLVVTNVWKDFGFGTIVYLAAITSIDPTYYEAAVIDGAGRIRQTWHITMPGMRMIIVLMAVLSLGNVLNAGFDQVYNLYSPVVYETGDILDTAVYRMGLLDAQYGPATAVGLFKSVVSLIFISISYLLAYKLADYRIF
jgi:putative aldouronate transport system permease protein